VTDLTYHQARFSGTRPANAPDFWDEVKAHGDAFRAVIDKVYQDTVARFPQVASYLTEFKDLMTHITDASCQFREDLQRRIHNVDTEHISTKLSAELDIVYEDFKAEFSLPLPKDEDARYSQRKEMISWLMRKVEDAVVRVLALDQIPEPDVRARFREIEPKITDALLIAGKLPWHLVLDVNLVLIGTPGRLIDKHPILVDLIIYSAITLVAPESWLLRPLFRLFGFGPDGPVKGSSPLTIQ